MIDQRQAMLIQLASDISTSALNGQLVDGKPIQIKEIGYVKGPRAGAIEIDAGMHTGKVLNALSVSDAAKARYFIPWTFPGSPNVYMYNRFVRVEAGWPNYMAENRISVSSLPHHASEAGRWVLGKNEDGLTVTFGLTDISAHVLISGMSGSGKSVAVKSAITQLSRDVSLVLVDGKWGKELRHMDHLPNVIGPLATTMDETRNALAWVVQEMQRRYQQPRDDYGRIVLVIDEVQEFAGDPAIVEMIRKIAAQGRGARISIIPATQHPTNDAFGDPTTKRNITGRIALLVNDAKASEVALGQTSPRADWLLGEGDAYGAVGSTVQRVQIAYVSKSEITRLLIHEPHMAEWPQFEAEKTLGNSGPLPDELGAALISAAKNEGRSKLQARVPIGDNNRAVALLKTARATLDYLRANGADVCLGDEGE